MELVLKGKFLELESRPKKDENGTPTGEHTDYVKVYSGNDVIPVKLPGEWRDGDLSQLMAYQMGDEVELDVNLNHFNGKLYFKVSDE